MNEALPVADVWLDGDRHIVLVDIWCSRCVAHVSCCKRWKKEDIAILTISGKEQRCEGTGVLHLQLGNGTSIEVKVFVVGTKPLWFLFVSGMNGATALGGVSVNSLREVRFGVEDAPVCATLCPTININEKDFSATYDAASSAWTVVWKWTEGEVPGVL